MLSTARRCNAVSGDSRFKPGKAPADLSRRRDRSNYESQIGEIDGRASLW
jgi:hypothetical protein